jgi:cell division septum initiation protein DivIVA
LRDNPSLGYKTETMDKFLEFLNAKRTKLQKQLHRLQEDIAELDKAEKLYRASGASPTQPTTAPQHADIFVYHTVGAGKSHTIKARVISILEAKPSGLTSGQILDELKHSGLPQIKRESLSPQLTRLKIDREIDLDHGIWTRAKKHEAQGS